jgi:predicted unusual protein kinase regulating ubiquinone biosynthesis (AarF/ABC1/UbiB family)
MFLNSIFVNYLYYKCFNKTSNNLIVILSYSINLNGCIIIKLIQWINNQLFFLKNINDNNKFINQIFSQYYENCYIHNLNYTKSLFYTEFGIKFDDFFELDTNFTVKSGSIAQVYKGIIKNSNIINIIDNYDISKYVAIKVVHPEIKYQLIYPIYFLKLFSFFISKCKCLKKYDTTIIFNFDAFFCNLKKQINMINEYANNEYFYNKYYNHNIIVIPKPLMKSEHFLIMEYIEGETFDTLTISNYKKQIIVCLIALFIKDTYMFGKYVHSDLHDANWKILRQKNPNDANDVNDVNDTNIYKIIIYDFGYVIENNLHENFKKLIYYLDINNTYELGNLLFLNVQNLNIDYSNSIEVEKCKEKFIVDFIKYNEQSYPYTDSNYIAAYNFCHNNGYKLNNSLLDLFICIMLLHKYFRKYIFSIFITLQSIFLNYIQVLTIHVLLL